MTALPEAFTRRMRAQLGAEADAYFAALEAPYVRGVRANPRKPTAQPLSMLVEGLLDGVPWEPTARYLAPESRAGALALHEAGAYYLQEPSAMLPARALTPEPGMTVLDLCSAPGGKATQLAAMLAGQGLLVCNEPVPSRAQVLRRNLERMGVPNALAVCATPERLAALWPGLFDAVLVDAPCSGEGMFRRHPETRLIWQEGAPEGCAARQRGILEQAARMLKPGGRLCYATCTLNREEDERVVEWLLRAHPELRVQPFALPSDGMTIEAPDGSYKLYPHRARGEGHFLALFQKANDSADSSENVRESAGLLPAAQALSPVSRQARALFDAFCQGAGLCCPFPPTAMLGDALVSIPSLPPVAGLKVLRAGVRLGECRGNRFEPDHALAMALPLSYAARAVALTEAQAYRYLRGEALPTDELPVPPPPGYLLATYEGLALGWVKHADRLLKNHYPKGLRLIGK